VHQEGVAADLRAILPPGRKDCDFSALLKIEYDNCDITSVEVRRVELLSAKQIV
jgi:hypothetical protein